MNKSVKYFRKTGDYPVITENTVFHRDSATQSLITGKRQANKGKTNKFINLCTSVDNFSMNRFCPQIPVLVKIYSECAVRPGMGLL